MTRSSGLSAIARPRAVTRNCAAIRLPGANRRIAASRLSRSITGRRNSDCVASILPGELGALRDEPGEHMAFVADDAALRCQYPRQTSDFECRSVAPVTRRK